MPIVGTISHLQRIAYHHGERCEVVWTLVRREQREGRMRPQTDNKINGCEENGMMNAKEKRNLRAFG